MPPDAKPEVLILAANSKRQLNDAEGAGALYDAGGQRLPGFAFMPRRPNTSAWSACITRTTRSSIAAADQFLSENPDPAKKDQVQLLKAEALFKDQKYAEAAPVYAGLQDSMLASNYRAEALFKLGWCYMQTKEPEKAIAGAHPFPEWLSPEQAGPLRAGPARRGASANEGSHRPRSRISTGCSRTTPRQRSANSRCSRRRSSRESNRITPAWPRLSRRSSREFPHTSAAAQANYWIGWAAYAAKDYKASIAPLEMARKLDKAQFFERATLRIIAAHYTLEERDALAAEVDLYNSSTPRIRSRRRCCAGSATTYLDGQGLPKKRGSISRS